MAGRRARHVFNAVALVVGIVAFAIVFDQIGWDGLRGVFAGTGWWFLVIAATDLASVLSDAGGVCSLVRPQAAISYWRVFAAQASGLAINRLTPGNSMGEPVKVTMLAEHVPVPAAVSSIVMFNLATYIIAIGAIAIGVPLTLLALDLPVRTRAVTASVTVALCCVALGLIVLARRGALGSLVGAARAVRLISEDRAARWRGKVGEIDARVKQLGTARAGFAFVLLSRVLNWTGTIFVMIAAGVPLTPPLVLGMLSVGILITWMSNVIPLGLGIADGSNYALYGVLGSTGPTGLAFTLINRARTCVLAAMGLTVMLIANLATRRDSSRASSGSP